MTNRCGSGHAARTITQMGRACLRGIQRSLVLCKTRRIRVMADSTLKKLISLIESAEKPEVRRAAVVVAGALKPPKEAALHKALVAVLDVDDAELRRHAVDTLGELRAEE